MKQTDIFKKQLEKWVEITANMIEDLSEKDENEITQKDIIKVAQKVNDVANVLIGKSKISGWKS